MKIYNFLKEKGEETVSAIVGVVKLTQPTISYHLKEMREAGLLKSRKSGKEVYYSLTNKCPAHDRNCVLEKVVFPHD
jgi:ArsR family transcriptional regulator